MVSLFSVVLLEGRRWIRDAACPSVRMDLSKKMIDQDRHTSFVWPF